MTKKYRVTKLFRDNELKRNFAIGTVVEYDTKKVAEYRLEDKLQEISSDKPRRAPVPAGKKIEEVAEDAQG